MVLLTRGREWVQSMALTICRMRWKDLPWKLKACSNNTLSSTVHSSGKGVKLARSVRARSTLCLCQNNMPSAWRTHTSTSCLHVQHSPQTRQDTQCLKDTHKHQLPSCSTLTTNKTRHPGPEHFYRHCKKNQDVPGSVETLTDAHTHTHTLGWTSSVLISCSYNEARGKQFKHWQSCTR